MKKSKIVSLTLAGTLTATVLLAGTYAWTSISQVATNEVIDEVNPGGRLHDDFNGENKDIYVENFTSEEDGATIYARIRLSEYLEMGSGAGTTEADKTAKSLIEYTEDGKKVSMTDKTTWTTYKLGTDSEFREYFEWNMGGVTDSGYYMPTFNKNKDSLEADINGTLEGPDNKKYDTADAYDDYVDYAVEANRIKTEIEIYDVDSDDAEEPINDVILAALFDTNGNLNSTLIDQTTINVNADGIDGDETINIKVNKVTDTDDNVTITDIEVDIDGYITPGTDEDAVKDDDYDISVKKATHNATAMEYENVQVISMAQWISEGRRPGAYWVYDTDGWAYWAQGIAPGKVTGCLLNGIERQSGFTSEYYYAIDVTAQFATAGDWGTADDAETSNANEATGFYIDGITDDGLRLLNAIASGDKKLVVTADENYDSEIGATPETPVQLTASVKLGTIELDDTVEWSIAGAKSENTGISSTGKLTIGEDETAEYIVVTVKIADSNPTITKTYDIKVGSWYEATVDTENGLNYAVLGEERQFVATLVDQREKIKSGEFNWMLVDDEKVYGELTEIDAATGKLTVDAAEQNETITVRATWSKDSTITDIYEVKVISQLEYIEYMPVGTLETVTIDEIEWYVLKKGETSKQALLWAANSLGDKRFDETSNVWEDSEMRSYLNSDEEGGFLYSLTSLKDVAVETELTTRAATGSEEFKQTKDKVFLFSEADIFGKVAGDETVDYREYTIQENGEGVSILPTNTNIAKEMISLSKIYWLRSPGTNDKFVAYVNEYGQSGQSFYIYYTKGGIRPALWIDLNNIIPE